MNRMKNYLLICIASILVWASVGVAQQPIAEVATQK